MNFERLARVLLAIGFAAAAFISPIAFAEEDPVQLPVEPGDEVQHPDYDDEGRKFDSRMRLARTVLYGDHRELVEEKEALEEAEALLQRAIDAGAEQEVIDRIQAEVDRRQAAVDGTREEIDRVRELVKDLSPEQVFAYNRSLNNAISSGLVPQLDFDLLQRSLGADLDKHQINALTQALEQEARFGIKADDLRDLAEETGDDSLLAKADRMDAKGEAQKEKFLDKVRRGNEGPSIEPVSADARDEVREESRRHARAAARGAAQKEARKVARESARDEARVASRKQARGEKQAARAAQQEVIKLARATAREEARVQGKANGKAKKN